MEEYQKRVIAEKAELDLKIIKLATFIHSDKFDNISAKKQDILYHQLTVMMEYSKSLCMRMDSFKSTFTLTN